jgi:hypothetical protein
MKTKLLLGLAALLLIPLQTCSTPTDDRQGPNGTQPDQYSDATHVTVYRNANNVPNVALFCLGPYGWASTLSSGDSGANKASALVRFESYDRVCAS